MSDLPGTGAETRRLLLLALIVLVLLLALHFTPLKDWLDDVQDLKQLVQAYGWKAYVVFSLASVAAIAVGVPRLMLCGVAGALFGFVAGGLVSLVSSVSGSYGAFLLARWGGRDWAERRLAGASAGLRSLLAKPSIGSIFIARQLPLPGILVNALTGILPTRHSTFLVGTFIGYLPSTAIVALAGSSLGKESLAVAIGQVSLAMAGLGGLTAALFWLRGRFGSGGG